MAVGKGSIKRASNAAKEKAAENKTVEKKAAENKTVEKKAAENKTYEVVEGISCNMPRYLL